MAISGRFVQIVAATSAALSVSFLGTTIGWSSPILPKLEAEDSPAPINTDQASWLASVGSLVAILPNLVVPMTVDIFGRKKLLLASAFPVIIHWLMIAFSKSFGLLLAARMVGTLGTTTASTVSTMYLAEIGEAQVRGALSALYQVMMYGGLLYIYCIGPFVSVFTSSLLSIVPVGIFLISFIWMPESPYFFMLRGMENEATKSLLKLRQKSDVTDLKLELENTRKAIAQKEETRGSFKDLFLQRTNRRTLLILSGLTILQVASGSIALMTYATDIFTRSGTTLDPDVSSIIVVSAQMVSSVFSVALLDFAGRRPLMILSFLGCGLSQIAEGIYFYLSDVQGADVSALYWLPLTALIAFQVIFSLGLGSVLYVLMGEIFHVSVKGLSTSLMFVLMALIGFLIQKMYPDLVESIGAAYLFFGFGIICICGAIYTFFLLPETKGKTFAEINDKMEAEATRKENIDSDSQKVITV